jgi:ABC-type transport system substrate-binding protein
MSNRRRPFIALRAAAFLAVLILPAGCAAPPAPAPTRLNWVVGRPEPVFDPHGPADPVRASLERLLSRGLVAEDSSGTIVPACARRWQVAENGLSITFDLDPNLTFTDGTPCRSGHFRHALLSGLTRGDHSTPRWLLGAIRGMDAVRAGRPAGPLGIEAPDSLTLVLHLATPDPQLIRVLALPGVSMPWKSDSSAAQWKGVVGVGPYHVVGEEVGHQLVLAGRPALRRAEVPDTVSIRFLLGAGRSLAAMRAGSADLIWPLPTALVGEPLPGDFHYRVAAAHPTRRLLLVMRADVPPTSRQGTRMALVHGVHRADLMRALGAAGRELTRWLPGAPPFDFPPLDAAEVSAWMERAKLGRSFHVTMAYDADGVGTELARVLQGDWSGLGIYLELVPLRGAGLSREMLGGSTHLALVESQSLIDSAPAELASVVMPMRGPPVGTFRTGWRTREFDPWITSGPPSRRSGEARPPLDVEAAQHRLEEELVVLPIAELPWLWIEREGAGARAFHPRFGPETLRQSTLTNSD